MDDVSIKKVAAPWKCTAEVHAAYFLPSTKGKAAAEVETIAYSPLEKESYFASPEAGRLAGGIGSFMLVRYTDTPVGTYDELAIIPGACTYQVQDKNGKWVEKKSVRVTRIYVSQKDTMYNGRLSESSPLLTPPPPLLRLRQLTVLTPKTGTSPSTSPPSSGRTSPTGRSSSRSSRTTRAGTQARPRPAQPRCSRRPSRRCPSCPPSRCRPSGSSTSAWTPPSSSHPCPRGQLPRPSGRTSGAGACRCSTPRGRTSAGWT